jgi:hypothetical protein
MARGRPPKPPQERKVQISVRLTPELLEQLEKQAAKNKSTISEEISARLATSFTSREAYVRKNFGDLESYMFCILLAIVFKDLRVQTGHRWFERKFTFKHAVIAAQELFSYFQPTDRQLVPRDLPAAERVLAYGADPAPILEQAKDYPFGKLAARDAVRRLETEHTLRDEEAGDEDLPEGMHKRERELIRDFGYRLRGLVTTKGQAGRDIIDWKD